MPSDFRTGIKWLGYFNYFLSKSVICICIAWELKCPLWTSGFSVTAQVVAREPFDSKKKSRYQNVDPLIYLSRRRARV